MGQVTGHSPLFRRWSLEQHPALDGPLLIRPPRQGPLLAVAALATTACLLALLGMGGYSARLSVPGYLEGALPLLQVTATREGRIGRILVLPGQHVAEGQPLFELLPGTDTTTIQDLPARRLAGIEHQAGLLAARSQALENAYRLSRDRLAAEDGRLARQQTALERQRGVLERQLAREQHNEARQASLVTRGYLPVQEGESAATRVAQARMSLLRLEQELDATVHARLDTRQQQAIAGAEYRVGALAIDNELALLESRKLDLESATAITVHAPRPGRVGELLVSEGTHVQGRQVVLGLADTGQATLAELVVPARLMPVIHTGMPVTLSVQDHLAPGLPLIRGQVHQVGATPLPAGMRLGPLSLTEASFRVRVRFSHVPGELEGELASGTHRIVRAQLVGPRHSLLSWVIAPLRQLPRAVT